MARNITTTKSQQAQAIVEASKVRPVIGMRVELFDEKGVAIPSGPVAGNAGPRNPATKFHVIFSGDKDMVARIEAGLPADLVEGTVNPSPYPMNVVRVVVSNIVRAALNAGWQEHIQLNHKFGRDAIKAWLEGGSDPCTNWADILSFGSGALTATPWNAIAGKEETKKVRK